MPVPIPTRAPRFNEVGPGYFGTLGIPLMSGRELTRSDFDDAPKVAIVNEQFARKFDLGRRRRRQVDGHGWPQRGARYPDRGPRAEREVQRGQERDPPALLHALPPEPTPSAP